MRVLVDTNSSSQHCCSRTPRLARHWPDQDDQPILDAALAADVDVILTGDKHLLALDLARPQILTPRAFIDSVGM